MIIQTCVTITSIGFEITAYTQDGVAIKESYLRGPKGYDCYRGNFKDEQEFDDHAGLLMALGDIVQPVMDLAEQLRLQKEISNESSN